MLKRKFLDPDDCQNCGSSKLVEYGGDCVCMECGIVKSERAIDYGCEYRIFSAECSGDNGINQKKMRVNAVPILGCKENLFTTTSNSNIPAIAKQKAKFRHAEKEMTKLNTVDSYLEDSLREIKATIIQLHNEDGSHKTRIVCFLLLFSFFLF